MKASELKIGQKIRIVAVPGVDEPDYYIHPDTVRAYKKVIARKRAVTISKFDEFDAPWFSVILKGKNGRKEWLSFGVFDDDKNWVAVRPRKKMTNK